MWGICTGVIDYWLCTNFLAPPPSCMGLLLTTEVGRVPLSASPDLVNLPYVSHQSCLRFILHKASLPDLLMLLNLFPASGQGTVPCMTGEALGFLCQLLCLRCFCNLQVHLGCQEVSAWQVGDVQLRMAGGRHGHHRHIDWHSLPGAFMSMHGTVSFPEEGRMSMSTNRFIRLASRWMPLG